MARFWLRCDPTRSSSFASQIDPYQAATNSIRTTKPKILRRLERILLGGFLGVLRVLAVNADLQINRQDVKDAKKAKQNNLVAARLHRVNSPAILQ